jgi:hypothetical protein
MISEKASRDRQKYGRYLPWSREQWLCFWGGSGNDFGDVVRQSHPCLTPSNPQTEANGLELG